MAHPDRTVEPRVLVTTRPAGADNPTPMRVKSVRFHRDLAEVKHVGLFGQISHRRTAQQQGFDDAVFVDAEDAFTEGATWNIGFLRGREVVWPEADCLVGVTMRLLQSSLNQYDMAMKTEQLRRPQAAGRHPHAGPGPRGLPLHPRRTPLAGTTSQHN
jgi:branched-subunit amino acid aminotransferase/4-amino-4-deoxychorismate lyase